MRSECRSNWTRDSLLHYKLTHSAKGPQGGLILTPGQTELRINTKRKAFPLIDQVSLVTALAEVKKN